MPRTQNASLTAKPRAAKPRVAVERKRTPVRRKTSAPFDAEMHREEIAYTAYMNWLGRGAETCDPDDDWFRAEQAVRAKYVN